MSEQEIYMQRCFELAQCGLGNVAPNPMVGSILVCDDKIIGEGYHQSFGQAHAEVNAINAVCDKSKLAAATLYVNLEPCSHFGKTPPCAELIIKSGIKKVVISCLDPNPQVNGKGVELLQANGVEVVIKVLEGAGEALNRRFFTFYRKKRPFIILKWAQTLNGCIDIDRNEGKTSNHITCKETDRLVHRWRGEEQGILVGRNTVANDNPLLTVRHTKGKNPVKIILDNHLELAIEQYQLFGDKTPAFIFNKKLEKRVGHIHYFKAENLQEVMSILYAQNVQSLIVEGGKKVLESFIREGLWDEARVFVGNKYFENGIKAPEMPSQPDEIQDFFEDKLLVFNQVLA